MPGGIPAATPPPGPALTLHTELRRLRTDLSTRGTSTALQGRAASWVAGLQLRRALLPRWHIVVAQAQNLHPPPHEQSSAFHSQLPNAGLWVVHDELAQQVQRLDGLHPVGRGQPCLRRCQGCGCIRDRLHQRCQDTFVREPCLGT